MSFRFLVDECLSPELVQVAVEAGHAESTCVLHRGLAGMKDWQLIEFLAAGDYTLVTHNAIDFRGKGSGFPGGLHAKQSIHAGLVCLNSEMPMDLDRQVGLFRKILDKLAGRDDLINQAVELFEDEQGTIRFEEYFIPAQG
jgi:hypothetical protein